VRAAGADAGGGGAAGLAERGVEGDLAGAGEELVEGDAAAAVGAGAKALDDAASDAADLVAIKRANAQARAEEADAAAAKPSSPSTGASGTKPAKVTPRGAGSAKRPPAVKTIPAADGWTHEGQLAAAGDMVPGFAIEQKMANQPMNRAYVGGTNIETGEIALASSGGGGAPGGIGPTCGFCAEGNVVRALGGDPELVRMTHAYQVQRGENGLTVVPKPVCKDCQADYPSRKYFVPGIQHERGGPWDDLP
ncbi:hypothetical protein ACFWP5_48945, partial [Streptomyces sp. NPDC058469]